MTDLQEHQVHDLLHEATDHLRAPVDRLASTATYEGSRIRRRRRVLASAGAGCAAVLVAVPLVLGAGTRPDAGGYVATDPGRSTAAAPEPTVSPSVLATPDGTPDWTGLPAPRMLTILKSMTLPGFSFADPITTNVDAAPGEPEHVLHGWLEAGVVVDGHLAGSVNVVLFPADAPSDRYTCPGNLDHPDSCTLIHNGSGTIFGRRSVSTMGATTVYETVLRGPGGGGIYVAATNATDTKWGPASPVGGSLPPLTVDQVFEVAQSDAWTSGQVDDGR
jgi:hypothetical protein